jgi:hypothetical protein
MPPGPNDVHPCKPGQGFQCAGTGDPNVGVSETLKLLALGQMSVGVWPGAGSCGKHDSKREH